MRFNRLTIPLVLFAVVAAGCTTSGTPDVSGMSFSDRPLSGKVIWNDLITEDIDAARRFYGGLFGWTFEESRGQGGAEYSLARDGGVYVAGLLATEGRADGRNVSRWVPYLSVGDVDEALQRAVGAGANVAASARDVSLGRVAAIVDPQGAVIGLANSSIGDPDDRTTRAAPGRPVWHEMLSRDPIGSAGFYRLIAGYEIETLNRGGGEYTMLIRDGVRRAGIMARPNEGVEPVWLTHFGVSDPAAAARRAESLGGSVIAAPSPELRGGTLAIVTDPSGAVLVLSKTSN
ncbi:MAG: VOC family protein [Gammaproteobacteria bacterium]